METDIFRYRPLNVKTRRKNPGQGRIQNFQIEGRADPGFSFRGGAKDYMRERTFRARNPKSLSAGFFMLSSAIWALFLSILIQNGLEKKSQLIQL